MLASITPLGERSRGFSWRVTASAFAVGAVGAGAGAGAALGALGSLLPAGHSWRAVAIGIAAAAALLVDGTPLRRAFPTHRRQVNEDWLGTFRGWVYGVGFGAQLGVGVATVVNSAAIYAVPLIELISGGAAAGAVIGAAFGATRALSLLPARSARDLDGLQSLHRRLIGLESPMRRAGVALELLAVLTVIAWAT
jgi:hypothetical protein